MSPKSVENTERVSTFISKELAERLKDKAKEKGMTVSGYIRLLIIEAVSKEK